MSAIPVQAFQTTQRSVECDARLALERRKSLLFRCWIFTGLFFMVLPGTVLGFSNLLAISAHHGLGSLSPAWIQAHGFSQVFGWIGSFVLGIGFYSQPHTRISRSRLPWLCWIFWTGGLILHWLGTAYLLWWRFSLPAAGLLQFTAMVLFLRAAREHRLPSDAASGNRPRMEPWMQTVLVSNAALLLALAVNLFAGLQVAIAAATPEIPHGLDQSFLVLLGWGFLAPLIWGFSARWLPTFLGVAPVRGKLLQMAVVLDLAGVAFGMAHLTRIMTPFIAGAAIMATIAIRTFEMPTAPAKTIGIHRSFPVFLRIAFTWSICSALLGGWAAWADVHGGIWGASRHALTVGFAAMMVMTVGPRILPHFAGVRGIWSRPLMYATLLLLCSGCTLRVSMEPLAYEGLWPLAWKLLPLSGFLELGAVILFALQLTLTFLIEPSIFANYREPARQKA